MKFILSKIVPPSALAILSFIIVATQCSAAAPANDNLANAQVIAPGSSFSVTGNDFNATREAFEDTVDYPLPEVTHTVWYAWTPTVSGDLTVQITRAGGLTAEIGVFEGPTPGAESFLGQDSPSNSIVAFVHVDAGQQYLFSIGNDSAPGLFTFAGTIAAGPAFFTGETVLTNGVHYLAFSTGNPFGYYSYLTDARYIYHFDLGYEYVFDANDGNSGVYLYDFKSSTFFYTSPSFPFPYLYDFTLNTVLYYYPNATAAGRYTADPRYFYNFASGEIITK